jgi:hypothetical protein
MSSGAHQTSHCVALFACIHDVIAGEDALRRDGIWCDMVPTPRPLSTNCGMVLAFRHADLPVVAVRLRDCANRCIGLYRREGQAYEQLSWRGASVSGDSPQPPLERPDETG